jgi:DNA-binding IclR family transcriptional regulator
MATYMLRLIVTSLLEKEKAPFLTHKDIAKKLKKDKAKVSGYLEAMVDYGDLSVKRLGNSKAYFLKK